MVRFTPSQHICPGCGAPAEVVPAPPPDRGQVVMVPHGPGCPVERQVAEMRARAQTGGRQ